MASKPFKWSPWQAAKVFVKTIYGDLYGDTAARGKLIQRFPIAQKTMPLGDRTLTFLVSGLVSGLVAGLVAGEESKEDPPIAILFLHGSPGSALCWKGFLSQPGHYKIIALDRPGFGAAKGSAPELEEDIGPLGKLLERIAAENGAVIVAGHSLGAGLAARLAAEHPDWVRGLLLIGGSVDPRLEKTFAFQRVFTLPPFSWLLTRSLRRSNWELLQYTGFLERLRPELARVTCPVAVVHSRDDRLVPYENANYAKTHFTNASAFNVISFESGGHFINHSRIGAIKQALNEYIVGAG